MPGNNGPPSRRRAIRFSRSSSFTRRARRRGSVKGLRRNSPRVREKLMVGTPKMKPYADYTAGERCRVSSAFGGIAIPCESVHHQGHEGSRRCVENVKHEGRILPTFRAGQSLLHVGSGCLNPGTAIFFSGRLLVSRRLALRLDEGDARSNRRRRRRNGGADFGLPRRQCLALQRPSIRWE